MSHNEVVQAALLEITPKTKQFLRKTKQGKLYPCISGRCHRKSLLISMKADTAVDQKTACQLTMNMIRQSEFICGYFK